MEKLYRVQMNSKGMPDFSTAKEVTNPEDYVDRYYVLAELDPLSYEYKVVKELPSVIPTTERKGAGE